MQLVLCIVLPKVGRWFVVVQVLLPSGEIKETPQGDLCWPCGTSLEVWPLESRAELVAKIESRPAFRREFMAVRAGAEKAEFRLFRMQEVRSDKGCGMRVSLKAALVEDGVFKTHFWGARRKSWV